ncbi:hypothetical protein JX265_006855 [Neoarthrinium moseri]|uniref:Uncharacterized protein n=1 Tax=Neoarthrinium moseri TaxID=1658444 RepID=A0A9P9WLF4_9PEZI|nr:hypothetical protein JX265_006855 [Neoarthrinium moseri]
MASQYSSMQPMSDGGAPDLDYAGPQGSEENTWWQRLAWADCCAWCFVFTSWDSCCEACGECCCCDDCSCCGDCMSAGCGSLNCC